MASPRTPRRRSPPRVSAAPATPPAAHTATVEGEAWYRAVFDQAAVGIARVAPDGCFLEVNDRFCEIVDRPRVYLMAGG